jgi:hypothetical protein
LFLVSVPLVSFTHEYQHYSSALTLTLRDEGEWERRVLTLTLVGPRQRVRVLIFVRWYSLCHGESHYRTHIEKT